VNLDKELYNDDNGGMPREEYLRKLASDNHCDLLIATDQQLFLDIDSQAAYDQYRQMLPNLKRIYPVIGIDEYVSRNKSLDGFLKRHIIIELLDPLTISERIALQAILGSDPMKEFLSIARDCKEIDIPVCLLKPRKLLTDGGMS
jgi:hypothetical protein